MSAVTAAVNYYKMPLGNSVVLFCLDGKYLKYRVLDDQRLEGQLPDPYLIYKGAVISFADHLYVNASDSHVRIYPYANSVGFEVYSQAILGQDFALRAGGKNCVFDVCRPVIQFK